MTNNKYLGGLVSLLSDYGFTQNGTWCKLAGEDVDPAAEASWNCWFTYSGMDIIVYASRFGMGGCIHKKISHRMSAGIWLIRDRSQFTRVLGGQPLGVVRKPFSDDAWYMLEWRAEQFLQ